MKNYYFSKIIVVFQDICPVWGSTCKVIRDPLNLYKNDKKEISIYFIKINFPPWEPEKWYDLPENPLITPDIIFPELTWEKEGERIQVRNPCLDWENSMPKKMWDIK